MGGLSHRTARAVHRWATPVLPTHERSSHYGRRMGKNSKARRDAKAKVRRRQDRAEQGGTPPRTDGHHHDHGVFGGGAGTPPDPRSSMFRSSCSECGSADISWMTAGELAEKVPADERARVHEGVEMVGPDADAWLCGSCGNFGLMSPSSEF